jgi:hypothetical protein
MTYCAHCAGSGYDYNGGEVIDGYGIQPTGPCEACRGSGRAPVDYDTVLKSGMVCLHCEAGVAWVDAPTGGWWAHGIHPDDDHDAFPRPHEGFRTVTCTECGLGIQWQPDPHGGMWIHSVYDSGSGHQASPPPERVCREQLLADVARYEEIQGEMNENAIGLTRDLADSESKRKALKAAHIALAEQASKDQAAVERVKAALKTWAGHDVLNTNFATAVHIAVYGTKGE